MNNTHKCECNTIDWNKLYENPDLFDHKTCKCCESKKNRGEITLEQYKNICEDYKKYYSNFIWS